MRVEIKGPLDLRTGGAIWVVYAYDRNGRHFRTIKTTSEANAVAAKRDLEDMLAQDAFSLWRLFQRIVRRLVSWRV